MIIELGDDIIRMWLEINQPTTKSIGPFGVEGVKIPAYQGSLSLKLLGPQQVVNLVHMLLRFGMYSGVGIKTAMGMGAFQIAERNVLHEGRSIQAHNGGSAP